MSLLAGRSPEIDISPARNGERRKYAPRPTGRSQSVIADAHRDGDSGRRFFSMHGTSSLVSLSLDAAVRRNGKRRTSNAE